MKTNNTVGSAKADIVAGTKSAATAEFVKGKNDINYRFSFVMADLPWEDDAFRIKMCQAAGGAVAWRSTSGLKTLGDKGGVIDAVLFTKAVYALDFRGEERPNAEDIKNAKTVLNYSEQDPGNPEIIKAQVLKDYGWEVEITLEGLAQHMMKKRQKIAAAKASDPLSLLS